MTTTRPTKLMKSTVDYREGDAELNCGTCAHFKADSASCRIVEGAIDPRFWCTKWRERTR